MKKIHHKLFFAIDCTILIKPVHLVRSGWPFLGMLLQETPT